MVEPAGPRVIVADNTAAGFPEAERWAAVAGRALAGEGVAAGRLDLVFVDPDDMAELNARHLGGDGPTDVLSFPLDADQLVDGASPPEIPGGPPLHLGDVVVCPAVAAAQAPGHCGSVDAELTLLIVHGVLHVLGHDHAEPAEARAMLSRERAHLAEHGLTHPGPVGQEGVGP